MADLEIKVLNGPERVRRRPAVAFGAEDIAGVQNMVVSLLGCFLEEARQGHVRRITLTAYADGALGLQDDGRGIWFGADDTLWQALFCQLFYARRGESSPKRKIFEDPGGDFMDHDNFAVYGAVCGSEYMEVHSVRDGVAYKLHFEKGENAGGLHKEFTQKSPGTALRFKADGQVFTETRLPKPWLFEQTRMLAVLVPGLTAVFREESEHGFAETAWCYPNGIVDFFREIDTQCTATAIYTDTLSGQGQERYNLPRYDAKLQIGLRFSADPGFVKCYHNFRELTYGGRHLDILLKKITESLHHRISGKLTREAILERLQLVVVSESSLTEWENFTYTEIKNTVLRDMASDLIGGDFDYYIQQNKAYLEALFWHK